MKIYHFPHTKLYIFYFGFPPVINIRVRVTVAVVWAMVSTVGVGPVVGVPGVSICVSGRLSLPHLAAQVAVVVVASIDPSIRVCKTMTVVRVPGVSIGLWLGHSESHKDCNQKNLHVRGPSGSPM